jgi:hypothetical protein
MHTTPGLLKLNLAVILGGLNRFDNNWYFSNRFNPISTSFRRMLAYFVVRCQ